MKPAVDRSEFPQANRSYTAPGDMTEEQVATIAALATEIERGSLEGASIVVVKWIPSEADRQAIAQGKSIFLSVIGGGLPPHMITTDLASALNPA